MKELLPIHRKCIYDTVERGLHEQINAQLRIPRSYTSMNLYYQSKYSFNYTNVFYDDLNYKKEIIGLSTKRSRILSLPANGIINGINRQNPRLLSRQPNIFPRF